MRCKKCGAALRTGTKVCPYCGETVRIEKKARSEFKWDVDDMPKTRTRKSAQEMNFSWNTEDEDANGNGHAGADTFAAGYAAGTEKKRESVNLFSGSAFGADQRKPEFNWSAGSTGTVADDRRAAFEDNRAERLKKVREESTERFKWNSELVRSGQSRTGRNVTISKDMWEVRKDPVKEAVFSEKTAASEGVGERQGLRSGTKAALDDMERNEQKTVEVSRETGEFSFAKLDLSSMQTERAAAENKRSQEAEDMERSVFDEFRNIVDTERSHSEETVDYGFMSEEDAARVNAAQEKAGRLTAKPDFAFDSIENEYDRYRHENGSDGPMSEAERRAILEKFDRKSAASETKAADADIDTGKNDSTAKTVAPERTAARPVTGGNREVNIQINEPSGTTVTVKTQEFSIADIQDGLDVKTKEVDLSDLKSGPKNVQVSVEVNGPNDASVEVTRRHDGATVVKAVDKNSGIPVVVEDDPNKVGGAAYKDRQFWEHGTDENTRMTITDIFGPEARKIIEGNDRDSEPDTLMLDIKPEDIALSEEQTRQLMLDEDEDDLLDDIPDIDLSNVNLMEDEEYQDDLSDVPDEAEPESEDIDTGSGASVEDGYVPVTAMDTADQIAADLTGPLAGPAVIYDAAEEAAEAARTGSAEAEDREEEISENVNSIPEEDAELGAEMDSALEYESAPTGEMPEIDTDWQDAGIAPEVDGASESEDPQAEYDDGALEDAFAEVSPEDSTEEDIEEEVILKAVVRRGPTGVRSAWNSIIKSYEAEEAGEAAEMIPDVTSEAIPEVSGPALDDEISETPEIVTDERSGMDVEAEEAAEADDVAIEDAGEAEELPDVGNVMAAEVMAGAAVAAVAGNVLAEQPEKDIPEEEIAETTEEAAAEAVEPDILESAEFTEEERADFRKNTVNVSPAEIKRIEKEEKARRKQEKKENSEKNGFSTPVRVIITVLAILLVLEFSIIGIKLFARDSQANVFIERVEEQVFSLIDGTGDSGLNQ